LSILFIHFCALLTPGPDFFIVTAYALKTNLKKALLVALGVSLAICIWIIASLSGLNLIFTVFPSLRIILTILGGIYLLYLAFLMFKSLKSQSEFTEHGISKNPFLAGFITNIGNVKALFYFVSIFSSLNFNANLITFVLLLTLESFVYFSLLALIFSNVKIQAFYTKYHKKVDFICSVIFFMFAIFIFINIFKELI